jgi:hypothetical protein
MTRDGWMRTLAEHFDRMRSTYHDDELAIVFDIDGTIVDACHLVMHVLLSYDRMHDTNLFHGITISDVVDHEVHVDRILSRFALSRTRSSGTFGRGTWSTSATPRPWLPPTVRIRGSWE